MLAGVFGDETYRKFKILAGGHSIGHVNNILATLQFSLEYPEMLSQNHILCYH